MKKRKPLPNRQYPVDLLQNQYWYDLQLSIRYDIYEHRERLNMVLVPIKPFHYFIYLEEEI